MAYNKHEWKNGDDVSTTDLNRIENGIHALSLKTEAIENNPVIKSGFTTIPVSLQSDGYYRGSKTVYYGNGFKFNNVPIALATVITTAPNTAGVGVTARDTDSIQLTVRRSDNKETGVTWIAIGK